MKFCSECGSKVSLQFVSNDDRQRLVCDDCGTTHYQNQNVLVAVYVCVEDEILWIRRGIVPAVGLWAIPGGYMERGETPEKAVSRELLEETGISVSPESMSLVSVSSIVHMAQTHLVFRCHLAAKPRPVVTAEAIEFGWYSEKTLPWSELAFPTIEPHVRQVYRWLQNGNFGIRVGFIDEDRSQYKTYPLAPT
jgi:ADP-ribose pyrophosphatase YjhB (NUDIX family)